MIALTEGKPAKNLLLLSIPMVLSIVFQQIYNLTDTVIVGKAVGYDAVSAVGEAYSVSMIFMAIATGASIGITVVTSRFLGAGKRKDAKTVIYSSFAAVAVIAAVLSIVGALTSKGMLILLGTPEDGVLPMATEYLEIYFYGLIFIFIYNACNGVFNAMGDSATSLAFLIFSSVLNVGLDLLFVLQFKWGVAGAAWATFISQVAAAVLAFVWLIIKLKKLPSEKPQIFSWKALKEVAKMAIPSILQQSFVSVGNLLVLAKVNTYSKIFVAAFNSAIKLNTFAVSCLVSMSNAVSTFTAQNLGAGSIERVKKGYAAGNIIVLAIAVPFIIVYTFFGQAAIGLFMQSGAGMPDVTASDIVGIKEMGAQLLRIIAPFYLAVCFKTIADGVNRGAERLPAFLSSTFSDLLLRVALAYILTLPVFGLGQNGIAWAWSIGWALSMLLALAFYFTGGWKKSVNVEMMKQREQNDG